MYYDQKNYDIRCEWGAEGLSELLPGSRAIVIVDVLSFSTCVDIAVENGAMIYPYRCKDRTAAEYARARNAIMANFNREYEGGGYSLAPSSLVDIPPGTSPWFCPRPTALRSLFRQATCRHSPGASETLPSWPTSCSNTVRGSASSPRANAGKNSKP